MKDTDKYLGVGISIGEKSHHQRHTQQRHHQRPEQAKTITQHSGEGTAY
jgi:phosphoserine aminotransferase